MLIVVNVSACGGRARGRWQRVRAALEAQGTPFRATETLSVEQAREAVEQAWGAGERRFVAAGGDGTVNSLLNLLLELELHDAELGAIGLGSSNDVHKPTGAEYTLAGCPVRLGSASAVDVGRAEFSSLDVGALRHHFLINASLGAFASANGRFNRAGGFVRTLKRVHTELAIVACALAELLCLRVLRLQLIRGQHPPQLLRTTNLAVLKRVHVAGGMRYDTPVAPDDGLLAINWLGDVGRWRLVRALLRLYRGRFRGTSGSASWLEPQLEVESEAPTWLELDGEVWRTKHVRFSVVPRGVRLCSPGTALQV